MEDIDRNPNDSSEILGPVEWDLLRKLSLEPGGFRDKRTKLCTLVDVASDNYTDLETSTESVHRDERQIGLDTDRSFVLYPVDSTEDREHRQIELHELIVSVFRKRQRLNYFQGYHDVISVLFLTLPKELQAPCAEKLSLLRLRDSMGVSLEPVVGLLRILKRILHCGDPSFAALLERNMSLPYFALSHILTLLSHDVPSLPLIQHVFDYLLCRPPIAIVYLVAAVPLSRREEVEILEKDGEDGMIHSLLSSLPELYEEDERALPIGEDISKSIVIVQAEESVEDEATARPDTLVESMDVDEISPGTPTTAASSTSSPSEKFRTPSPTPSIPIHIPQRPRVSLTSLFLRADELYTHYSPSHPSIALSSIMGPQSVMLTWSENSAELPTDDEAELMVTKPELVVRPYIEPEDEVVSDEEQTEKKDAERRRRRKPHKPRQLERAILERKTVVAGAVLVLGVAVVVYGMQSGQSGGGHHPHHTVSRELRRVSQFVGGVLLGMGERAFGVVLP
ncbi:rab-GTPase-TBC domain-containing protein [Sparassis latifolia]